MIVTNYRAKAIPERHYDWSAVDYDAEQFDAFAIGYGATKDAAISDLQTQTESARHERQN